MPESTKNLALVFIAVGAVCFFIIVRIWFPPVDEEGENYIHPRTAAYMASCDARGLLYLPEAKACVDKAGLLHEVIVRGKVHSTVTDE